MRIRILATAAALVLGATACSERDAADPAAPKAAEAAPLTGRAAVYAAAEKDPEAFVRALYVYTAEPWVESDPAEIAVTPGRDPIYSRTLNALFGIDYREAEAQNVAPHMNANPICDCQDTEGLALRTVTVTPDGPQAATAHVVHGYSANHEGVRQTLKLVKEGPMWRVADVINDRGGSLHDELMEVAEKLGG